METSLLSQLQGTWILESMRFKDPDGKDIDMFGSEPVGITMFESSGYMNTQIGAGNRPDFKSDILSQASDIEISKAFKSYLSFFGRYSEHSPGVLLVKIEGSLFPNWQGEEIIRYVELKDNILVLTSPPTRLGESEIVVKVVWRRTN